MAQKQPPIKTAYGREFLRQLVEVLGLGGRSIRRCVIDFNLTDVVKIYVEEHVEHGRLANLLGELPNLEPDILMVDRVKVENADGTKVVIKQVETPDTPERELCKVLLNRLESIRDNPAEMARLRAALYGPVVAAG